MAMLTYAYTTVDPQTGSARTFTVTTDSRLVALQQIRGAVQRVNWNRQNGGGDKLIALPKIESLDSRMPDNDYRIVGRVSMFA
jgi:hypothetical protein